MRSAHTLSLWERWQPAGLTERVFYAPSNVGNRTLATYEYTDDGNNYLKTLAYGNQDSVSYEYDKLGRLTLQTYEDDDSVKYSYDNNGDLAQVYDSGSDITTKYYYDLIGRAIKYTETKSGYSHSVEYAYDTQNNLSSQTEIINGTEHNTTYTYDKDNRVTSKVTDNIGVYYTYDSFGRLTQQVTKNNGTVVLTESYTYNAGSSQIATYSNTTNGYSVAYSYTYDDNGNILSVSDGAQVTYYKYDSANQLIREDSPLDQSTWVWSYDNAGNITACDEYLYTIGELVTDPDHSYYQYNTGAWGDLLVSDCGISITYDEIGNPLTYGSSTTYTWEHGRELASMTYNGKTWYYTYDSSGMRTKRTDGTTTYEYTYNGSQLIQMTVNGSTLFFAYDATGRPATVTYNGTVYYYITNLQGDVMSIVDGNGTKVANYEYNAWGKQLGLDGTLHETIEDYNPLRYRGYVFDLETNLYYLQSRYYDPWLCRFINADGLASTGQGLLSNNAFAYCLNNPISFYDPTGEITIATLILVGSAIVGAVCAGYTAYKEYQAGFDTVQIVGDSICAGFAGFSVFYSAGTTLYQCYQNYCYLNALTPVTNIGGSSGSTAAQLQTCANKANAQISGSGPTVGTKKHAVFANEVNALGNSRLVTEISYKNGEVVPYGTSGSIRFDVLEYTRNMIPAAAWDLKTGSAALTQARIDEMIARSGLNIPIFEVR